ncbi:glycerol-3-phosphate dehydrogenase/oxidase [Pallidibacillus thermolactis]|jgi:glycerol-3-phosphate dehydrogenase|uniref:glycerol-3-phosphate dehydrogenase/oxidase n=1 Tax=Pallidibacillus thermolactis TaxID=251051 RepID=UPI0021D9C525|nr:glycerol-3-phosphate dehydrogenase/oxidase [Pallidibacillus thermolactis]MCU9601425.1 glycerol-3-phosphate dehydrogenase/oxidase [Pallidibacillus thermolactis subsp. kokeshiiformis]MED1674621.1 glycerol-3-phosphate dehydrogenase/oxidase [Pallidibacillus thermolactis subsp. kokeshiiformis]
MQFSNKNRQKIIDTFKNNEFDVVVIGGGITGAGIALDATTRGMKVALVEMQDFAAGTSSRSTKLVHGGLRYLKQFHVKQVAEVGRERAIVYENGPHVTTPEWMLLPFFKDGTFGKFFTSIGLTLYDRLAGVKKSERKKMLTAEQTLQKAPLVKKEGLKGGGIYVEYRTDDARLTIEVMKKAVEKGATVLNYSKVEKLVYSNGKVIGVEVIDQVTGETYKIRAKKVVNATGPWVDTIREKDNSKKGKVLQLTKGVHIVIDQSKFPLKQAVYFDTPDGRMVFAIPREGKAYVGTTDTFYDSDPINPQMTKEDLDYLLKAINFMFPDVKVSEKDVESNWAGVRPLIWEEGKDPSEISRKDEIWESESGLMTIAGGKLTGYRKMAEKIVDLLVDKFEKEYGKQFGPCVTKHTPISGGDVGGSAKFNEFINEASKIGQSSGLSKEEADSLASKYGSNVYRLFDIVKNNADTAKEFELPITLFAELQYALTYEMVVTPVDFFLRRTGAVLFNIHLVNQYKENVIQYMQSYFNWDPEMTERYQRELEEILKQAQFVSEH